MGAKEQVMNDALLIEEMERLQELIRLRATCLELLDYLQADLMWIYEYSRKHHIPIQDEETLQRLLHKTKALITEMSTPRELPPRKI